MGGGSRIEVNGHLLLYMDVLGESFLELVVLGDQRGSLPLA